MVWHWTDVPNWVITAYGSVSGGEANSIAGVLQHIVKTPVQTNSHFRLLMAAKWKFLKFGICKKFQWNFVYFLIMNYYGCMSLLFWKGRLYLKWISCCSRLSAHLSRACVAIVPRNDIALQNSSRVQLLPRVFLHLDPCSLHLHTEALSGTLTRALRLSHPSACRFNR